MFCRCLLVLVGSSIQFSSVAQSCPTLCDPMNCSISRLPVHRHLPEFTQTHIYRVGYAIQPFHPLSSLLPPALNPSEHQSLFQGVNSSHEVAKVLEFQLQHHSFQRNGRLGLISFRMDWLDLLAVQGTLKSLLQHHSSKALILCRSAFYTDLEEALQQWRRKWQPTPVLLPGKSHGQRAMVVYSP